MKHLFATLLLCVMILPVSATEDKTTSTTTEVKEGVSLIVVNEDALQSDERPKIGLVLSGGGAKGSAHIGVIRMIEEIGIPIDYVAGTSMGSIIGGLFALGYTSAEMDAIISEMDWPKYMKDEVNLSKLSFQQRQKKSSYLLDIPFKTGSHIDSVSLLNSIPGGIVSGNNLENLFNSLALGYQGNIDFNDLPIPYACVGTDLVSGEAIVFRKGNLPLAIRSSMSIPGLFAPVYMDGMVLVDGGMLNNIPIDVCKEMGADIIIAVMVGAELKSKPEKLQSAFGILGRLLGVITSKNATKNIEMSDIFIKPDLGGAGTLSFDKESIAMLIANGYKAAEKQRDTLQRLKNRLAKWGEAAEPHLNAPKASNANTDLLRIRSIDLHGVSEKEERWLLWKSQLKKKVGTEMTGAQLDENLAIMYGTNNYTKVSYSIEKDTLSNEYDVNVKLQPKAPSGLRLAFRGDVSEAVSLLVNFGLNSHRLVEPQLDITAKIGYNPYLDIKGSYGNMYTPKFTLEYFIGKTQSPIYEGGDNWGIARLVRNNAKFYMSGLYTKFWDMQVGIEYDQFLAGNLYTEGDFVLSSQGTSTPYLGAFGKLLVDTRDNFILPTKGIELDFGGHYRFLNMRNAKNTDKIGDVMLKFKSYIPITDRLTFTPQIYGRAYFGKAYYEYDQILSCYDMLYLNYVGGQVAGSTFEQQLPMFGVTKPELLRNFVLVGNAELRYNIFKTHYVGVIGAYQRNASSLENIFYPAFKLGEYTTYGSMLSASDSWTAGLRLTEKLPIGPAFIDVAYSSLTKSVTFYLSVGLNF
ncbi:MAG: patatin-like phospholipase family protein [Bacteroidales bacterium]|nr:patatin-like phospholipase family protein [Bacteroidales bacterium]